MSFDATKVEFIGRHVLYRETHYKQLFEFSNPKENVNQNIYKHFQ